VSDRRIYEYAFVKGAIGGLSEEVERGEVVASNENEARLVVGAKLGYVPTTGVTIRPF
jgi:hypothetical protein